MNNSSIGNKECIRELQLELEQDAVKYSKEESPWKYEMILNAKCI